MTLINVHRECIDTLDLTPAKVTIEKLVQQGQLSPAIGLQFAILYDRALGDPREFSEIPEIRLWFVRLDGVYPWLPYILDWRSELARYTAMLVPHQFSPQDGIVYNPEALEIFLMGKLFIIWDWQKQRGETNSEKLQQMALALGFEVDRGLFSLLG
jgi:hypothetical protein